MFKFAVDTIDMTAAEILNYYRNLYYAESQVMERGIVANAINDYFNEAAPRAEVAREIIGEILSTHTPDVDGFFTIHESELTELKNKYAEGEK